LTTGSNNVDISNPGAAGESNTLRIGVQGTQTATYIAGIFNSSASGGAVEVSNTGKLGMVLSSARYKRDIHDMNDASSNLMKLRPVTFRYKNDAQGIKQYGLVAEEVEPLYPELVIHSADGQVQSVRYSMLTSMLLNELQKQARTNQRHAREQAERNRKLEAQVAELTADQERQRVAFEQRLATLERDPAARDSDRKLAFNR
jgi:Chaperone of endosialidase